MASPRPRANNAKCEICGKDCYVRPSRLKTQKHVTCSMECSKKARSIWMKGEGNHQYGLKQELNASYIGKEKKIKNGYEFIRIKNHPFAEDDGFIRKHRLVAERYLMTEEQSVIINGNMYLNPELEVHHIDENKLNNSPENLIIVTKSEHRTIHNLGNVCYLEKDKKTGRFIRSSKKDLL